MTSHSSVRLAPGLHRGRAWLGRGAAALVLATIVVGPPIAVAALVGRPFPDLATVRTELDLGRVSDDTLLRTAAAVCVISWLWAVTVIAAETIRVWRRRAGARAGPASSPLPTHGAAGVLRRLVRHVLVGAVAVSTTVSSLSSASAVALRGTATPSSPPAGHVVDGDAAVPAARTTTVVSSGRETALSLAIDLGDESLRATIIELNRSDRWSGGTFPAGTEVIVPIVGGRATSRSGPAASMAVRTTPNSPATPNEGATHVVSEGETLSSIAADRLGEPRRWTELWSLNRDRAMNDGRRFDDPDLILPGWSLQLPPPDEQSPTVPEPHVVDVPGTAEPTIAPPARDDSTMPDSRRTGASEAHESSRPGSGATSHDDDGVAHVQDAPPHLGAPASTHASADDVPRRGPAAVAASLPAPPAVDARVQSPAHDAGPIAEGRSTSAAPMGIGGAMLSAGLLGIAGAVRRRRLRSAAPGARLPAPSASVATVEGRLRRLEPIERLIRVDVAIRALAARTGDHDAPPRVVLSAPDGTLEVVLERDAVLDPPWSGCGDRWQLGADVELEQLGTLTRETAVPCPALVQVGVTPDGHDVYVNLETVGHLDVVAPPDRADAVVTGIATILGSSVLAEVVHVIGVGVTSEAFVGHRWHSAAGDLDEAIEAAVTALGRQPAAPAPTSRFAQRAKTVHGDAWEPAVVLATTDAAERGPALDALPRTDGLALVTANGPRTLEGAGRIVDDGRRWTLRPEGIDLVPVGLTAEQVRQVDELIGEAARVPVLAAHDDGAASAAPPRWRLLVRLLGPVDVIDQAGAAVRFERSKTLELIAWLATHRDRSTRSAARTALWELDVRDATFANVVSEARRAMARLVTPAEGDEWLARTLTEELPLHTEVRTDAEVVEALVSRARVEPPDQAIETLTEAVDLVRGMPFEATSYVWPDADGITSNLVLLSITACAELASRHLERGDVEGVFAATSTGLRVLAGHEELIALRMRAHATTGDLAGVRQEWEAYERTLLADPWSDGEPAVKLVELRRELTDQLSGGPGWRGAS